MVFKNDKVYDFLKWVALVALDAVGLAYKSLAQIWGLPFGDQIHNTTTILAVLLGTLIGVSSAVYQKSQEE